MRRGATRSSACGDDGRVSNERVAQGGRSEKKRTLSDISFLSPLELKSVPAGTSPLEKTSPGVAAGLASADAES